jgi:immunity protein 53 of polymorphic toxin system
MSTPSSQSELLAWLQEFYAGNCNGDWEHLHGVTISTLDNPGWSVEIDLEDSPLEARVFERVERESTDTDWIQCWVEGIIWHGRGGARNLQEILEIFRRWVVASNAHSA